MTVYLIQLHPAATDGAMPILQPQQRSTVEFSPWDQQTPAAYHPSSNGRAHHSASELRLPAPPSS
jgi:hypothetical protein